jgi:hypothetical protein
MAHTQLPESAECREERQLTTAHAYELRLQVAEKGNLLVVATVLRDRAYLMTMKSTNSLAWRKNKDDMRAIRFSTPFFVRAVSRRDIAHGTDSGTAGMGSGRIGFPRRDSFTVFD